MLLTLSELLQFQRRRWTHLNGIFWCDNKRAVQKFNEVKDDVPFSLTIENQTNANVLQEIRLLKKKLPVAITAA